MNFNPLGGILGYLAENLKVPSGDTLRLPKRLRRTPQALRGPRRLLL